MKKIDFKTLQILLINFADAVLIDDETFANFFLHTDTIVFKKYREEGDLPKWDWWIQNGDNIRIENDVIIAEAHSGGDVFDISIRCFQSQKLDAI